MLRGFLALVFTPFVVATTSNGGLMGAVRKKLRVRPHSEEVVVNGLDKVVVNALARTTLKALLAVATDPQSEAYYNGRVAPLNQRGYEQMVGNQEMTAFITHFMETKGIINTNVGALQGFVMYYDGTCHKKSFSELERELGNATFRDACHEPWVRSRANIKDSVRRTVSSDELNAMLQEESISLRAAAFSVAKSLKQNADSLESVRNFILEYISELHGNIRDEDKFEAFLSQFIRQSSNTADPLQKLIDLLAEESVKEGAFVELPRLPSRSVKLTLIQKRDDKTGIGATAPLDELGYNSVADFGDLAQMTTFVHRTADRLGLRVVKGREQGVEALAKWYDVSCAKQSFAALTAELRSVVVRPAACGGAFLEKAK